MKAGPAVPPPKAEQGAAAKQDGPSPLVERRPGPVALRSVATTVLQKPVVPGPGAFGLRPGTSPARGAAPGAAPAGPPTPQSEFCASIGIDLSALTPFELRAAQMKLKRLMQLNDENSQLTATVEQRLVEANGNVPPDVSYFLKLIDEPNQETTIIKVTTNAGLEELRTLIAGRLERSAELELLMGDDGKREPLNAETLRARQVAVLSKKVFAVTVVASE